MKALTLAKCFFGAKWLVKFSLLRVDLGGPLRFCFKCVCLNVFCCFFCWTRKTSGNIEGFFR